MNIIRRLSPPIVNTIVVALSVMVPILVVVLLALPKGDVGFKVRWLPTLNAVLNGSVALVLLAGLVFIRRKQIALHRVCMQLAFGLSVMFLLSYVLYHYAAEETHFGGEGWIRPVYFFILITHVMFALAVVPLALFTLLRAWQERFELHRQLARFTWPLWFYVSVTGVLVYWLISPYYVS